MNIICICFGSKCQRAMNCLSQLQFLQPLRLNLVLLTSWCVVADHFRTGFLRMETKAQEKADSSQEKRSEMHQDMYLGN
jgi:hypothetical protein